MKPTARIVVNMKVLDRLPAQVKAEAGAAIHATGAFAVADMVTAITTGAKSGAVYIRGGGAHQASAPGEAPANDTGQLAASIKNMPMSETETKIEVGAAHGPHLEFGTVKMAARPFFIPAMRRARDVLESKLQKLLGGVRG